MGSVLTNAVGRFILRAPDPGSDTVRADRIGFASTTSDAFQLAAGDTVEIRIVAQVQAIATMGSPRIRITEYSPQGFAMGFCIRRNRRRLYLSRQMDGPRCPNMLIVLDGRPLSGAFGGRNIPGSALLMDMEPEEIESVRVLSPVQGEFRYGRLGANGVLVIETRRGGRGQGG